MNDFQLDHKQRQALLNGSRQPLRFDIKPFGLEPGAVYVVQHTREIAVVCGDGVVVRIPREPAWWIVITSVTRHRKGGWVAQFQTVDRRDPTYFLKAGGGYTTSRYQAIDDLEVVDRGWLDRHAEGVSTAGHSARLAKNLGFRRDRSRQRRRRAA